MILSKLGRRVSAFALSVLFLSASVFPAFATSTSGQLPEVGWAETVSSFLMASGIYPFESDPETGYEEWSVSSLKALWSEFRDDTTQVAYDIVDLTGNLVKGVIAIASGRWSVLREFATWVVNKYDVQDNQVEIELGVVSREGFLQLPILAASQADLTASDIFSHGLYLGYGQQSGVYRYAAVSDNSPVYCFRIPLTTGNFSVRVIASEPYHYFYTRVSNPNTFYSPQLALTSSDVYSESTGHAIKMSDDLSIIPLYDSFESAADVWKRGGAFHGITADTTTVSIPAPLPSGTDFGGLAVSGTGVAVTPEQLEEIVQNAVKEALKPSVAVVPVAISPDVSVNPSGEITVFGDVTIDSGNIPLQPSDYSAPNLSKVFPFSIPWDILAVLNVLDAEPVRPEFNVDLYIPVLDVHVPWTIGVSEELQESVDNFMASMRGLLLVAMCVGTLWLFWRSNL